MCGRYILLATKIILGTLSLVVEVTGVLNGDGITLLGLICAVALGNDLSSDTHDCKWSWLRLFGSLCELRVKSSDEVRVQSDECEKVKVDSWELI